MRRRPARRLACPDRLGLLGSLPPAASRTCSDIGGSGVTGSHAGHSDRPCPDRPRSDATGSHAGCSGWFCSGWVASVGTGPVGTGPVGRAGVEGEVASSAAITGPDNGRVTAPSRMFSRHTQKSRGEPMKIPTGVPNTERRTTRHLPESSCDPGAPDSARLLQKPRQDTARRRADPTSWPSGQVSRAAHGRSGQRRWS
jgi:hypothetical protein